MLWQRGAEGSSQGSRIGLGIRGTVTAAERRPSGITETLVLGVSAVFFATLYRQNANFGFIEKIPSMSLLKHLYTF